MGLVGCCAEVEDTDCLSPMAVCFDQTGLKQELAVAPKLGIAVFVLIPALGRPVQVDGSLRV